MAAHRLVSTAFSRLELLLHQQAEQATLLGLHAPLDMQLSAQENDELYEELTMGLTHVQQTETRVKQVMESVIAAASMIAYLLRHDDAMVTEEEVVRALEEDDATWLDEMAVEGRQEHRGGGGTRGRSSEGAAGSQSASERQRRAMRNGTMPPQTSSASRVLRAESLSQALSNFRATHTKTSLSETWRSMVRKSQIYPDSLPSHHLRFLLDVEAQRMQEERVRENMKSRYSLQAALAAEWTIMQYEEQRRRSCSPNEPGERSRAQRRCLAATVVPPLDLVTNAHASYTRLQEEEQAYGDLCISSDDTQIVAVGQPSPGSTTSAKLVLERLAAWEKDELRKEQAVAVATRREGLIQRCDKLLEELNHVHHLRIANPTQRVRL